MSRKTTDPNGNSLRRPRVSSDNVGTADWMTCDAKVLQEVIAKAGVRHCAIRLGYTRDGGAYAIGVYAGDQYFTDYIRPHEDIDKYLADLLTSLDEYVPGETLDSQSAKSRKG